MLALTERDYYFDGGKIGELQTLTDSIRKHLQEAYDEAVSIQSAIHDGSWKGEAQKQLAAMFELLLEYHADLIGEGNEDMMGGYTRALQELYDNLGALYTDSPSFAALNTLDSL